MSDVMPYVIALVPSVGVGILFWIVIKNMIEGDRKERLAHSQWEAAEKKRAEEAGLAEEAGTAQKAGLPEKDERTEEKSRAEAQENHNGNS
jgi:hypothetical protein